MNKKIKEYVRERLGSFILKSNKVQEHEKILMKHFDYMINNNQKKTKVIYTCITGNYDSLILHNYVNSEWDYVCFTDNEHLLQYTQYGCWKVRPLVFSELDNTRNSRWHKTHPHILFPDYEESIFVDGNINIASNTVFKEISDKKLNIVIPMHWNGPNESIYNEAKYVLETIVPDGGETKENVEKMIAFLYSHSMPENYGLNETNLIYRKHNDKEIITIMEEWWSFIRDYTKRDQLSCSYILWKHNIMPIDISIPNLRLMNSADVFFLTHDRK